MLESAYERDVFSGLRQGDFGSFGAKVELEIARGNLDDAMTALDNYVDHFSCEWCAFFQRARVFEHMDSLNKAVRYYQADLDNTVGYGVALRATMRAPTFFRLGEIHSQLGNIDSAIEAYQKFSDIWVDADDILQPQVQYARDRIDQLLIVKAREPVN
ncbi:MAG: tetratricopeptide repeat protein [Bacteroidetes bacterium]|nr:MAG: tetratricopeptide repeat protein [Bacteroidota bacterium]